MWISNRRLDISRKGEYGGGWLTALMQHLKYKSDIELYVCYTDRSLKAIRKEKVDGVWHYGLPRKKNVLKYDNSLEINFATVIEEIDPRIIHIQGTENANGIAAMNAKPDRTYVVSIQGMIGRYSEHYVAGVPVPYCFDLTLRDLLNRDGPISKGKKFGKASWYENEMIQRATYVMVRTTWDKACVKHLHKNVIIYNDLRVLRPSFYNHQWTIKRCKRYSIFVGSSHNQIKGLHYLLQALPLIIKVFPETHLFIASFDFTKINSARDFLMYQTYFMYIRKIIKENNLSEYITFMGVLDENQMCKAFLDAHVFVLPSIIENSPNTLSEAAVLGVPTVASYVAGVPDLIEDHVNGFLYAFDEYYIMADRIIQIFENDQLATLYSTNLLSKARKIHDANKNTDAVYQAYIDIVLREGK